jgi:DNA polymerase-3 subunit gamma/tau
LLGTADEALLFAFADAVAANDPTGVLELVRRGMEEGRSMQQVTRELVFHFRNLMHLKAGTGEALELTADQLQRLGEQAEKFSLERVKEILRALSRAELDMKWHPYGRLVLEVALLELLGEGSKVKGEEAGKEVRKERPEIKQEVRPEARQSTQHPTSDLPSGILAQNPTSVPKSDGSLTAIKDHWEAILENMRKKSIYGFVSLHEGEPIELAKSGKLVIGFRKGYSFHKERLEEHKNKEALEESIREVVGHRIPVECIISDRQQSPTLSVNSVAEFFNGKVVQ